MTDITPNIVLIGAPGSGKSSIGRAYAKEHGYHYISSGDIARHLATSGDFQTAAALQRGEYASEAAMRYEVKQHVAEAIAFGHPVVLDGFPRTVAQLVFLERMRTEMLDPPFVFVEIGCPTLVCVQRVVARNRENDQPDAVESRFRAYETDTKPVIAVLGPYCHTISNVGPMGEQVRDLKGVVTRYAKRYRETKRGGGEASA